MLKLAEQRKTEKVRLLKSLASHLDSKGITATISEETTPVSHDADKVSPVLELKGLNIDSIRVTAMPSNSCGEMINVFQFVYRIDFNRELPPVTARQIRVKLNSKNIFGRIVSSTNGIKWHGRELAEKLNDDNGLSEALMKSSKQAENLEIEVYVMDKATIEIAGPWFKKLVPFSGDVDNEPEPTNNNAAYNIETYERIAGHIIALVETSNVLETVKTI